MIKKSAEKYINELKKILDKISIDNIKLVVDMIHNAYNDNKQIFILGNGGSAATASHFACDLGKGTLAPKDNTDIKRFKVTSLTDNVATMTAWGNDISYNHIFSEQLKNLLSPGDIVIGISVSGNSPNVINAIKLAKARKAKTIALTGFNGGKLAKISNINITARINKYDIAEDIHLMLSHIITRHFLKTLNNYSNIKSLKNS